MPFNKFKELHNGMGPFAILGDQMIGGVVSASRQVKENRSVLDQLVEEQKGNTELQGVMDDLWAQSQNKMTAQQLAGYTAMLSQKAQDVQTINTGVEGFKTEQARLRDNIANPRDAEQLDILDNQAAIAHTWLLSNNPAIQKEGAERMSKVLDAQIAFSTQNEAQLLTGKAQFGEQQWSRFTSLQDDLYRESSDFMKQRSAFGNITAAAAQNDAAGDLAFVFGVMKLLDPGSTVREGEFANAQNAGGVPDILLTAYNRLTRNGERLSPAQRAEFETLAKNGYATAREQQVERNSRYLNTGRAAGLDGALLDQLYLPLEVPVVPLSKSPTPKQTEQPKPEDFRGQSAIENLLDRIPTQEDEQFPIPFTQGIQSMWRPELRKQPGETDIQYRERLSGIRMRNRTTPTHAEGVIRRPTND